MHRAPISLGMAQDELDYAEIAQAVVALMQLWGHWVYVAALRLEDGSLLVVATQSKPKSAITD